MTRRIGVDEAKEREASFQCQCHTEQLVATQWSDDDELYISLWSLGSTSAPFGGWRQRLRHAWRALKRGTPYEDHIILSVTGFPDAGSASPTPCVWGSVRLSTRVDTTGQVSS